MLSVMHWPALTDWLRRPYIKLCRRTENIGSDNRERAFHVRVRLVIGWRHRYSEYDGIFWKIEGWVSRYQRKGVKQCCIGTQYETVATGPLAVGRPAFVLFSWKSIWSYIRHRSELWVISVYFWQMALDFAGKGVWLIFPENRVILMFDKPECSWD